MSRHYNITRLKSGKNYDNWAEEIQRPLTFNKCWLVTIDKLLQPKSPPDLPRDPANIITVAGTSSSITVIDKEKENYGIKIEKYELKWLIGKRSMQPRIKSWYLLIS